MEKRKLIIDAARIVDARLTYLQCNNNAQHTDRFPIQIPGLVSGESIL